MGSIIQRSLVTIIQKAGSKANHQTNDDDFHHDDDDDNDYDDVDDMDDVDDDDDGHNDSTSRIKG